MLVRFGTSDEENECERYSQINPLFELRSSFDRCQQASQMTAVKEIEGIGPER